MSSAPLAGRGFGDRASAPAGGAPTAPSNGARRGTGLIVACFVFVAFIAACSGAPHRPPPLVSRAEAVPTGFPATVRAGYTREVVDARAPEGLRRVVAAANGGPVNVLALSGGGAGSAFGAGALVGWSRRGTRPDFQIVTGVSAGALIAPFAFLGPGWDDQLTEAFSGAGATNLMQRRWAGTLLGSSLYRGEPLVALVDKYVTDAMLAAIAREAASGRLLLVATTDLDKQRTVIWNLGVVAAQGGERGRRLFRDILVASASIPGVFPPVLIHVEESGQTFDELHVDGGTTAPLFIAPEIVNVLPDRLTPLRGANVYVIVNGQLGVRATNVRMGTIPVVKRSVYAALQSSSRMAVEMTAALARQNGMRFTLTEIPNDFPYRGPIDVTPPAMKALFDFGVRCAREDALWMSPVEALERADEARLAAIGPAQCPAPSNPVTVASSGSNAVAE